MQNPKQVIILRKDLNMRKGKCVAQGAHASVTVALDMERKIMMCDTHPKEKAYREWSKDLQTKICVSVSSEQELLDIYEKAKAAGIPCALIKDAGLTEFKEPTYTAVAIGPDYPVFIDPITKHLPLL